MTQIVQALSRLFDRHRIIVWYDAKQELRREFEAVDLPGVDKIVLDNNEFGVKYRILREVPDRKFLLYHAGPAPENPLDNWLLDVELAYGQFRADQVSLWLGEMGLGLEFADTVAPHAEFFQAARRREALKVLLARDDTPRQVRLKMLAVCAGAEPRIEEVVEALLAERAAGDEESMHLIRRVALDAVLWEELKRAYGYSSDAPGIHDFAITLFQSCYAMEVADTTSGAAALTPDALVFLKRWKDSVTHHAAFEALSHEAAGVLGIEADLQNRDTLALLAVDAFELIDRKILSDLVRGVAGRMIPANAIADVIRQRRRSHWYPKYRHEYGAIEQAAAFIDILDRVDLSVDAYVPEATATAIRQYATTWYRLDQVYRGFIHHARQSGQTTLLAPVAEQVEALYTNSYLLQLNNRWQAIVDGQRMWSGQPVLSQELFFEWQVKPFLDRGNKVFVVISDALRYEIGEELLRLIRQENRYDAELEPALTLLPSVTSLGMAALLPHQRLALSDDGATALVDGESTVGTANRASILAQTCGGRATALQADELLAMDKDASRALIRDHDVVYIYHNRIDAVGDKRDTEERVFDAVSDALEELVRIIKKLANANANNLLVTADHGFIYQNQALDESDFASQVPQGRQITAGTRRYVLGRGLRETSSFKHFAAADVGLEGDVEMLIPKSINRLRVRGAGSRYVHGGATLQEVVIPVLKINKKRESDISQVEVDILRTGTSTITSGQLSVAFYQTEPATDKVQPRRLRAGVYTQDGLLISNREELRFDMISENARERELPVRFVLTREADAANGQEVILRLEEPVEGTSHHREYKTARYLLRRAFTSDFDF